MNPAYKYTPATSWMEAYKAKKALPTISELPYVWRHNIIPTVPTSHNGPL